VGREAAEKEIEQQWYSYSENKCPWSAQFTTKRGVPDATQIPVSC
jgi:hypothetical protein